MKNPSHPGEIIREEVIRPRGLSVTAAAAALGVTRQALSAFLNERSDLSPEMALRIAVAFGPKADVMMAVQTDYQMARAGAPAGDRGERAADQGGGLLTAGGSMRHVRALDGRCRRRMVKSHDQGRADHPDCERR